MNVTGITIGTKQVNPLHTSLSRIYNRGLLTQGGRFYCPFQNLKSVARPYIRFNNKPVVEIDFSALHPTIIYALSRKPFAGDAYDIKDFERNDVKVAFNIMLNRDGWVNKSSETKTIAN